MKLVYTLLVFTLIITASYAADKQSAQSDASRKVHFVAPFDVAQITANTAIKDWNPATEAFNDGTGKVIQAINCEDDINVYFGTDTTNKLTVPAGSTFPIHPSYDVKIDAACDCAVF